MNKILIWTLFFVCACLVVLLIGTAPEVMPVAGSVTTGGERIGRCEEEMLRSAVDVYYIDNLGENIGGQFTAGSTPTIHLVQKDLATVSHEVSHLVDFLLDKRGIHDGETEAYFQGYYTQCVYGLVQ